MDANEDPDSDRRASFSAQVADDLDAEDDGIDTIVINE